jgi:hypothetical protein
MNHYRAEPGVSTPYQEINQLLGVDEKYLLKWSKSKNYLFIPKSLQCLSALLFLLKEKGIGYSLSPPNPSDQSIFISLQSLNQMKLLENDAIEVQTGCEVDELKSWLFAQDRELGWESLFKKRMNIRDAIQAGISGGEVLRELGIQERLLAVEIMKADGGIVKLGNELCYSTAGPSLHRVFWGLGDLGGILVKAVFKTERVPPVRLFLSWEFEDRKQLWKYFDRLKQWTSSWERLDWILPRECNEKCFIIGQISGIKDEMENLKMHCPFYTEAMKDDRFNVFKNYFNRTCSGFEQTDHLNLDPIAGDYLWYHGMTGIGWNIYKQRECEQQPPLKKILWKEHLKSIMGMLL